MHQGDYKSRILLNNDLTPGCVNGLRQNLRLLGERKRCVDSLPAAASV
jgi:hypothetical protein